jgi:hypothetical protein
MHQLTNYHHHHMKKNLMLTPTWIDNAGSCCRLWIHDWLTVTSWENTTTILRTSNQHAATITIERDQLMSEDPWCTPPSQDRMMSDGPWCASATNRQQRQWSTIKDHRRDTIGSRRRDLCVDQKQATWFVHGVAAGDLRSSRSQTYSSAIERKTRQFSWLMLA